MLVVCMVYTFIYMDKYIRTHIYVVQPEHIHTILFLYEWDEDREGSFINRPLFESVSSRYYFYKKQDVVRNGSVPKKQKVLFSKENTSMNRLNHDYEKVKTSLVSHLHYLWNGTPSRAKVRQPGFEGDPSTQAAMS